MTNLEWLVDKFQMFKKMKTVIHTSTGKVLRVQNHDIVGDNETLIDHLLTIPMIEPYFVNGEFIEGATPEQIEAHNKSKVPASVSSLRFWKAVFEILGITKDFVKSQVELIPDPTKKTLILIMLNEAQEFDRANSDLNQMATDLQIPQEVLDQIFITASNYIL